MSANKAPLKNETDSQGRHYIEFPSGTPVEIYLKHSQYIVFMDTHIGSSFIVTEEKDNSYATTATVTTNNTSIGTEAFTNVTGNNLTIPSSAQSATITGTLYVGEAKNNVEFKNENNSITPTGLNLNNLPFIAMIMLVFGAFIVFVVAKTSRKRNNYNQ